MRSVEPDAGELLVKALDLVVGASALARYAAGHAGDARLRRLFRQLATTSEHQERALRRQLARAGAEPSYREGRALTTGLALGLGAVVALGAGIALAARLRDEGRAAHDPVSRTFRGASATVRSALGRASENGRFPDGRATATPRGPLP